MPRRFSVSSAPLDDPGDDSSAATPPQDPPGGTHRRTGAPARALFSTRLRSEKRLASDMLVLSRVVGGPCEVLARSALELHKIAELPPTGRLAGCDIDRYEVFVIH